MLLVRCEFGATGPVGEKYTIQQVRQHAGAWYATSTTHPPLWFPLSSTDWKGSGEPAAKGTAHTSISSLAPGARAKLILSLLIIESLVRTPSRAHFLADPSAFGVVSQLAVTCPDSARGHVLRSMSRLMQLCPGSLPCTPTMDLYFAPIAKAFVTSCRLGQGAPQDAKQALPSAAAAAAAAIRGFGGGIAFGARPAGFGEPPQAPARPPLPTAKDTVDYTADDNKLALLEVMMEWESLQVRS